MRYNKFNRGEVDGLALARDDVRKVNNSGRLMENFMPIRLGPMRTRPGVEDLGSIPGRPRVFGFVSGIEETALVEMTDGFMRIWVNGEVIKRTSVSSAVSNGGFTSDLSGWTDASGAGSSTVHGDGDVAVLTGALSTEAVLFQSITTEVGAEHAIRLVISRAPCKVQIGISGVGSSEILSAILEPGTHSLVFTPSSDVTITLSNNMDYQTNVESVEFEGAGPLSLPTDITEEQLDTLRVSQSAGVMFGSRVDGKQFRIERRGVKSWAFTEYLANDGPFGVINNSKITLSPSSLSGDITLTASDEYFEEAMEGSLVKLSSASQNVLASVSAEGNDSGSIRVTGVDNGRKFTINVSGTFTADITLQRSPDDAVWEDVETYSSTVSKIFDDGLDNSILFYRLRVKIGGYTSGTVSLSLSYPAGSIQGICRIIKRNSGTSAAAQVLTRFGSTDATRDWYPSQWSGSYPSANFLFEGRLWFAGDGGIWGSVSDAYQSFDRDVLEGNSASIYRTIGFGPVDTVHWLSPAVRLVIGITSDEIAIRSSSFGEGLTPSNTNLKPGPEQGAAAVPPVTFGNSIYYVQRSKEKLYELVYTSGNDSHATTDLTLLNQKICSAGIDRIAISKQPETRIYLSLDDGSCRVLLFDKSEEVVGWSRITFSFGQMRDICSLPALGEDEIFTVVKFGSSYRLGRFAKIDHSDIYPVDFYVKASGSDQIIAGLDHLNGLSVDVWSGEQRYGPYTVSGGQISGLLVTQSEKIAGLRILSKYESNKIGQSPEGSVLGKRKRVVGLGLIGRDIFHDGFRFGRSFGKLDQLPSVYKGREVDKTKFVNVWDTVPFEFEGEYDADSSICVQTDGPATILGLVYDLYQEGQQQ